MAAELCILKVIFALTGGFALGVGYDLLRHGERRLSLSTVKEKQVAWELYLQKLREKEQAEKEGIEKEIELIEEIAPTAENQKVKAEDD